MDINQELRQLQKQLHSDLCQDLDRHIWYLPYELEAWFFRLLHDYRTILLNSENIEITKHINDVILKVLTNVVAGGERGLKVGQMTYNASAVTEHSIHETYNWAYGGGGQWDHKFHHTGLGINAPDFMLDTDTSVFIFDKNNGGLKELPLSAGTGIDIKDYMTRESAEARLSENLTGALGHNGGSKLLCHIISNNQYFITDNKAGAPMYPLIGFEPKTDRRQVSLSLDSQGILVVDYFN